MKRNTINIEKFASHYATYGNGTQAYMEVHPGVTYNTAKTEASKLLTNPNVLELIDIEKEKFKIKYLLTKEKMLQDLIDSAEEAKSLKQFQSYAKLREMVIKLLGFYEPERIENIATITVKFGDDK